MQMKAAVFDRYGPPEVVRLEDVAKPVPGSDEVLVKIHATTVSSADKRIRSMDVPGGFGPFARLAFGVSGPRRRILGSDLSGEIVEIGSQVTRFRVGQKVIASCGIEMGCHAQYRRVKEHAIIIENPGGICHPQAAALVFGGMTALDFLTRAKVFPGEKVLVNGAAGCVGSAVVQLASYFGCNVTGVCSASKVDTVKALGAHHVIDYTKTNPFEGSEMFDVIFDAVGNERFTKLLPRLTVNGRLISIAADLLTTVLAPTYSLLTTKRVLVGPANERLEHLQALAELTSKGSFAPLIGRAFASEEIEDAHRYAGSIEKCGSVVITF